jgi:hypothetical protein
MDEDPRSIAANTLMRSHMACSFLLEVFEVCRENSKIAPFRGELAAEGRTEKRDCTRFHERDKGPAS